jgi:hypothetical protein
MHYYVCKRCNLMFKQKNDIRRHLEKKNICEIKNNENNYTNEELYNMSLNKECEIKKNTKNNFCSNCNKTFSTNFNYKRHIEKKICLEENKETNNTKLIGFDQDWDVSKIDKSDILDILLDKNKFIKTLQTILKNEVNLNVIINNDNNGFVYKLVNNKYEPMKEDQIIQKSIEKIYKHLKFFYEEIISNKIDEYETKYFDTINNDINNEYYHFKNIKNNEIIDFYKLIKDEAKKSIT